MATFVLVHGGWLGGFLWRPVAERLRGHGHEAYTPTLTGLGERTHLAHPDVNLDTHIQDIVNVLVYEDLSAVVLVGFSAGGMVITGVADRVPERIAQLVYLDAVVPKDGESLLDNFPAEQVVEWRLAVETEGDGWLHPWVVPAELRDQWPYRLVSPHPWKSVSHPLRLTQPPPAVPRTFILCNDKPPEYLAWVRNHLAPRTQGWAFHELATTHIAMLTMPDAVTAILLGTLTPSAPAPA